MASPGADELVRLVEDPGRHVFVAKEPVDFRNLKSLNEVYVLEFPVQGEDAPSRPTITGAARESA